MTKYELPTGFRYNTVWHGGPTDGRNIWVLQQWGEWEVKRGVWPFRWKTGEKFWANIEAAGFFDTEDEAKRKLQQTARMMVLDRA